MLHAFLEHFKSKRHPVTKTCFVTLFRFYWDLMKTFGKVKLRKSVSPDLKDHPPVACSKGQVLSMHSSSWNLYTFGFFTGTIGLDHGLFEGLMMPSSLNF